jgi:hypothetical protein
MQIISLKSIMKMGVIIIILIFNLNKAYSNCILSITHQNKDSLPDPIVSLKVGNKYWYKGSYWFHGGNGRNWSFTEEIVGDTIINGLLYAVFKRDNSFTTLGIDFGGYNGSERIIFRRYYRHALYEYISPLLSETLLLNFDDTLNTEYPISGRIYDRQYQFLLGDSQLVVSLVTGYGASYNFRSFASKFGYQKYGISGDGSRGNTDLYSALIDNVLYGDTTLVGVDFRHSINLPTLNILYQNYPNPFNNTTIIRYKLSIKCYIRLLVYDLLGKEVALLIDGVQEPGEKNVLFDAYNLSSGMYFYRLVIDRTVLTNKFVLLR